ELFGLRVATAALLLPAALGTLSGSPALQTVGPAGLVAQRSPHQRRGPAPVGSRARLPGSTGRCAPSPMGRRRASTFPRRRPPDGGGGPRHPMELRCPPAHPRPPPQGPPLARRTSASPTAAATPPCARWTTSAS